MQDLIYFIYVCVCVCVCGRVRLEGIEQLLIIYWSFQINLEHKLSAQ